MEISEVTKKSGISASALRFYEEKGLIKSVGRKGISRIFDNQVLGTLALISLGKNAGFSLDEIAEMFTTASPQVDRVMLKAKADELDKKIQQLTAVRDGLRHAAVCSATSHIECPKFQRLLGLAVKSSLRKRRLSSKE